MINFKKIANNNLGEMIIDNQTKIKKNPVTVYEFIHEHISKTIISH